MSDKEIDSKEQLLRSDYIPQATFCINNFIVGISDGNEDCKNDTAISHSYTIELPDSYSPLKTIILCTRAQDSKRSLDFPSIERAIVTYDIGTTLSTFLLDKSKRLIERYILIFAIDKRIALENPRVMLESYSQYDEESDNIQVTAQEEIQIREKMYIFHSYGTETYEDTLTDSLLSSIVFDKGVVNTDNSDDTDDSEIQKLLDNDFDILNAIYNTKNIESRYLLQYEFLKNLVAGLFNKPHGSQEQVRQFVTDYYNPQEAINWKKINMINDDRGKNRDALTYYRNVIGHPPVSENEKSQFEGIDLPGTIAECSYRIGEVILFAIREKARLNGVSYPGM